MKNKNSVTAATRPEDDLKEAAAATRDGFRDMGTAAKDLAVDRVDSLAAEVQSLKGKVEEKIEQKPVNSALIAAGAGLLVGLLLRRN